MAHGVAGWQRWTGVLPGQPVGALHNRTSSPPCTLTGCPPLQLFPIVPIHRLDEEPCVPATLADLTCDSDGKIDRFINPKVGGLWFMGGRVAQKAGVVAAQQGVGFAEWACGGAAAASGVGRRVALRLPLSHGACTPPLPRSAGRRPAALAAAAPAAPGSEVLPGPLPDWRLPGGGWAAGRWRGGW